jgi:hypothetical protein
MQNHTAARGWYRVDAEHAYDELRAHARACGQCKDDLTLAVVSLRVCGELRFPLVLCPAGSELLADALKLRRLAGSAS